MVGRKDWSETFIKTRPVPLLLVKFFNKNCPRPFAPTDGDRKRKRRPPRFLFARYFKKRPLGAKVAAAKRGTTFPPRTNRSP